MLKSLQGVLSALAELGTTRLELAAVELEEERLRLADMLITAAAALFFFAMAVVLFTGLVVAVMWDHARVATIGVLGLLFLAIGAFLALRWRTKSQAKPRFLSATLSELGRDAQALRPRTPRGDSAR